MLHHACVPTHPEPTSQDTLQISIRKLSSHTPLFWTLLEQLGTDYTTHVCQPWTNVAKTHHKTSDPKIFISHIPVLNFAGTALHVAPRMCANPSWRHTTKSQTRRFSSHTPLFWTLPEHLSILHHACVPTLNQRPKDTPQNLRQTLRCLSHIFCFELCRNSSPCYTTHVGQPILNQRPKTHYKLQSENFHLTHPCFELCLNNSEQMTPRVCANPSWTNVPKLRPQDFYLTSLFWTLPEQLSMLHHACEPTHPVPTSQDTT